MPKPEKINQRKLLLAEGSDANHFLRHACRFYRTQEDVQVMNFGGNPELRNYLSQLANDESYDEVETIVIARDAEDKAESAVASMRGAVQHANNVSSASMPLPSKPFRFASNPSIKTAFMIFPGPNDKKGTLEDLCLRTVEGDSLMQCVDEFLVCVKKYGESLPRPWKNRLHCFLAARDKSVSKPIGLAFKAKIWNPDHPALAPFRKIIEQM